MQILYFFILLLILINLSIEANNQYQINDNIKFLKSIYNYKTITKQIINTSIGKITYQISNNINIDQIDFKLKLLYSLDRVRLNQSLTSDSDDDDLFKINKYTNEILINKLLVNPKNYHYNLLVLNKSNDYVINNVHLIIKVFNENYLIPKFEINPYYLQISDNTPPNTVILKLCAVYIDDSNVDNDSIDHVDSSNSVVYKIENNDEINKYFYLNANSGELRTKIHIDREIVDKLLINVNAVNYNLPQYVATTSVNVRVIDNSNVMESMVLFNQTEYDVSLNENEDYTKKPVVFSLSPLRVNTRLSYSLVGSKIDLSTFEIDSIKGLVYLIDKLDYEIKSEYKLTIVVTDLTTNPISYTYVSLIIKVVDINNNPPKFTEPSYEFTIINSSSISDGLVVGYIDAYDRDSVLKNNSKIRYFIENYKNYFQFPFQIGETNGSIYLVMISQFEYNLYDFNVVAMDRYGATSDCLNSTVNVKVKILNINDNYLFKFENDAYYLNVSEETVIGLPILTLNIVNINDKNTVLNFLINSGNFDNIFIVNKLGNTKAQILLANSLDYRKQSEHRLIIKAIDQSGLYATANVIINVLPVNAQQPRFTKDLYDFSVYENASVGALIGKINALDGDFGENGRIKYSFDNSTNTVDFKIDENDGGLYVARKLDREVYDSITLYVVATDNGSPQRMDRALIQIKILDCNDNPPLFTRSNYSASIYENAKAGTYLLRVEATDKDIAENSIVRYSLENTNSPFSIDPTSGIVRVSGKLDRETEDFYNITLIATDLGKPPLSSSTLLQIEILDINDNAPNFGTNELTFYLLENQPIGTDIANITATDPDLGVNADIVYKMLDGFEYFELKSSERYNTVVLTSKFIADYESNRTQYTFNLRAYSGALFTDCLVRVLIKDMNDNAPVLANPFKIIFNNYKNNFLIESFARIPAHDLDVSDNLTFTLLDSIGKQFVNVNSITGEITLKPILNTNNQINAAFSVSVSDGIHEVQSVCHLTVLMVSDNMLTESVTLSLMNADIDEILTSKFDLLTSSISEIPFFSKNKASVHVFNIAPSTEGVNVTFSVSTDYSKDIFVPSTILKQTLYSYLSQLEKSFLIGHISIYEDSSCAIEPCPNLQQCQSNVKFSQASTKFQYSSYLQFRSINVKYDFSCLCPTGFTGVVSSISCDLEINLCYSNPCGQNSICVSLESGYHCICDRDFSGRNCEYNLGSLECCDLTSELVRPKNSTAECSSITTQPAFAQKFDLAAQNRICKSSKSECLNNASNGITCEKCTENANEAIYYNKYCELRSKSFPHGKNAYLMVPGIKKRMRFKIKLTFATIKSDGYLFYNGELSKNSHDFIALEIENEKLVFSYSLGDHEPNVIRIDSLSVSDGKWHTVTLNYVNRNFTISVDNDNDELVDACELARNQNKNQTNECFQVKFIHQLPPKCSNPFESCYRYFDLNGPLHVGRGPFDTKHKKAKKSFYEGCISDLYINEQLIDFNDDNILDFGTEVGCKAKSSNICKTSTTQNCDQCEAVWNDLVKCNCKSNDFIESSYCTLKLQQNLFSFKSNGYLLINENLKQDSDNLRIEFYVKFKQEQLLSDITIFYLELSSETNNEIIQLKFFNTKKTLVLLNNNQNLLSLPYGALLDGFWHKISISISKNMSIELTLNEIFGKHVTHDKNLILDKNAAKLFLGGTPVESDLGINGCVKEIQRDLAYLSYQLINGTEGCDESNKAQLSSLSCGTSQAESPCFNKGICQIETGTDSFSCNCSEGYKGKYCQYAPMNALRLIADKNAMTCPAKWWGKDPGICGPCQCDESLNFSPDCNKSTGKCECKSKYYKKIDPATQKEYCVPCDCYLEGSSSLQCQPFTGQCSCLKDSGITGRRCDSCISPFAEIVANRGVAQCQLASNSECPKSFFNNIWWSRTLFNTKANASCPKGSVGTAYRQCSENNGWAKYTNLFDCKSVKLFDLQLMKWHDELIQNKSELSSYQAIKLAETLNRVTAEADSDDFIEYNLLNDDVLDDYDDDDTDFAPTVNYLYANDLLIIKNLTIFLINFEITNAPSFLYIQDKYYLNNFFSTVNRLISKKYEKQWIYLRHEKHESIMDLLFALDKYLNTLLRFNYQHQQTILNEINLSLDNLHVHMNSASKIFLQEDAKLTRSTRFKVINVNQTDNSMLNTQISYLVLKNLPNSLPTRLLLNNDINRQLVNFKIAGDVIMLNVHETSEINETDKNTSFNLIVEFQLKSTKKLSSTLMKSLYCVYLNEEKELWSTYGAKIISIDNEKNSIKCLFNHFSIYAVMMPINYSTYSTAPVPFGIVTYIFIALSVAIIAFTNVLLISLRKLNTALTIIYTNFCLNLFLMQIIYISGVNNTTNSTVLCKLIAVILHYLYLSTYLWLLIIALHLYRMLTELRDINKVGSKAPAFYYVIAYVIPTILTSLALGVKQELYTSTFISNSVSIYCWLNVTNLNDIIYALFIPILVIVCIIFLLLILSYKEALRKTFKQTDVGLVRYSMVSLLILLAIHCFLMALIFLQLSSLNSRSDLFIVYENLYLVISLLYAVVIVFLLIICDRYTKLQIYKNIFEKLMGKNGFLDESLSASKANLCNKSPFNPNKAKFTKDLAEINAKYMIDYHCNQTQSNSISTTTTSGTLENLDNFDELVNDLNMGTGNSNFMKISGENGIGYNIGSSNCCYTTTFSTDTTTNDSDINYRIEFNAPTLSAPSSSTSPSSSSSAVIVGKMPVQIRDCDIIDVSKVLKSRENQLKQSPKSNREPNLIVADQSINETKSYRVNNFPDSAVNIEETNTDFFESVIQPSVPSSPFDKKLFTIERRQSANEWFSNNINPVSNKTTDTSINIKALNTQPPKKPSQMPLFWPNNLVDCDLNVLDGSSFLSNFSPTKTQQIHQNGVIPDILSCSAAKKNSSVSSNSNTSTISTSNSNTNLFNSQTNYTSKKQMTSLIPVMAHSGSFTHSENDSNNETRV